jgi:hypothetical protein
MFGIRYIKTAPTQYVIHYAAGNKRRAGAGLAFFYYAPSSEIAVVPVGSADAPFIFNEMSADFQPVTVQGQLTYRITDPEALAVLLNFTVSGEPDQYRTDDPEKLACAWSIWCSRACGLRSSPCRCGTRSAARRRWRGGH